MGTTTLTRRGAHWCLTNCLVLYDNIITRQPLQKEHTMTRREARNIERMATIDTLLEERAHYVNELANGSPYIHKYPHYIEEIEFRITQLANH